MKSLFKNLMLVAVAAIGFTACEQEVNDVNLTEERFSVNIVGEFVDGTRSGFTGSYNDDGKTFYKSAWNGNENVVFSLNEAAFVTATNDLSGDKASFNPTFVADGKTEGVVYAYSPKGVYDSTNASACVGGITNINTKYQDVFVVVPAVQTPTATSVDPTAHILAGEYVYTNGVPSSFGIKFNHVTAYGKMTIKNFDSTIDKVEVIASEPLAGTGCYYYYAGDNKGKLVNANDNSIKINAVSDNNNVFWFGCAPADLSAGSLTVKIYSGEDTYTKQLNIADANFEFVQGRVSAFGVDMTGVSKDVITNEWVNNAYNLVKDVADLAVGDQIIIAAKGSNFAMSTTQNNNNRDHVAVTKNDNNTIDFDNNVQILTLQEGTVDGTFAFYTGSGYLHAASSSSNYLRTQTTNNANGSWSIVINSTDCTAKVEAKGDKTNNTLLYNDSSSLFSCYAASASQKPICIYKLVGEYTPAVPAIDYSIADVSIEADETSGYAIVTATNADGWDITAETDAEWVTNLQYANGKITFSSQANDGDARTATVTVTAVKEGYDNVKKTFTITQKKAEVAGVTYLIEEEFDNSTTSDSNTAIKETKFPNFNGATSKAYTSKYGGLKLGSSSDVGYITSKALDLSKPFIVEIDACKYGTDTGNIEIIVGGVKESIKNVDLGAAGTFKTFTLEFDAATATSTIKIATSAKRAYIDNVKVYYKDSGESGGGEPETPAEPVKLTMSELTTSKTSNSISVSWTAVSGAQNYAVSLNNGPTTTVAGTTHTFTGLNASTSYTVSVVAVGDGVNYTNSEPATTSVTTSAEQTGGETESVTATLSFANTAQRTSFSTSQQVWKQNGITFTNAKTSSSNNVANYYNPVRLYQNSEVTVEAPGNIKTITVDCTDLDNKYITPWGGTVTNKIVTITLDGTSNTYTISKLSAQARAYSITVTYLKENN